MRRLHNRFLLSLFFLLGTCSTWGQIWPGDVNNNGVVNNVDWFYLTMSAGAIGPPRSIPEQGIDWEEKLSGGNWGMNVPGTSIDLSFADCSGDGFIGEEDIDAIMLNFGLEHGTVTPDIPMIGVPGNDPKLFLAEDPIIPFPQGGVLFLEVFLGTESNPVDVFSGITFDVEFDTDLVSEVFFIPADSSTDSWGTYDLLPFQTDVSFGDGNVSIGFSTFGMTNIEDEYGLLGQLFIVIEDDVVGMQGPEIETTVQLENVFLFGDDGEIGPVINDTIDVIIVENPLSTNGILDESLIEVYPNPAQDHLIFDTELSIERVEIFNIIGQQVASFELSDFDGTRMDLPNLYAGIYILKVNTEKGILTKKIIKE